MCKFLHVSRPFRADRDVWGKKGAVSNRIAHIRHKPRKTTVTDVKLTQVLKKGTTFKCRVENFDHQMSLS